MAGGARVVVLTLDQACAMTPERWRQITRIFHAALSRQAERARRIRRLELR